MLICFIFYPELTWLAYAMVRIFNQYKNSDAFKTSWGLMGNGHLTGSSIAQWAVLPFSMNTLITYKTLIGANKNKILFALSHAH